MMYAWWEITLIVIAILVGTILATLAVIGGTIFLLKALVYSFLTKEQRKTVRQKVKDCPFPPKQGSGISGTA